MFLDTVIVRPYSHMSLPVNGYQFHIKDLFSSCFSQTFNFLVISSFSCQIVFLLLLLDFHPSFSVCIEPLLC